MNVFGDRVRDFNKETYVYNLREFFYKFGFKNLKKKKILIFLYILVSIILFKSFFFLEM